MVYNILHFKIKSQQSSHFSLIRFESRLIYALLCSIRTIDSRLIIIYGEG